MLGSSLLFPPTPLSFLSGRRFLLTVTPSLLLNAGKPPECCLYRLLPSHLCSSGTHDKAEAVRVSMEDGDEGEPLGISEFIEVGYISSAHGLKGELRVKPNTGFPELRFCKPGSRWLRTRIFGKETISEMQLIWGRSHPGQKCWIISFEGIDTVDKAKQIVGSTLLVREEDRPELEEDEFYTHDLVGMRVFHKETGMLVGTVADVFNSGANDLLHVMRASSDSKKDGLDRTYSTLSEIDASSQFVWIPFVEAIVPEVDTMKREMYITPPKGLLELNLRNDMRSKKERRQEEWRQKKKLQQRLIAAKKKLHEMGQSHVLDGFNFGEKDQKTQLATQIVGMNFSLFQHAVLSIERSSKRLSLYDFLDANSALLLKKALRIPYQYLIDCAYPDRIDELHNEGLQLLRSSKAAIFLAINGERSLEIYLQQVLLNIKSFLKSGGNCFEIPLIMIASTNQIQICEDLFSQNDYFGFNDQKVFFIEEVKLPIISLCSNKICLKSAWEILQASVGSGGIFASVTSQKCVDLLHEMGIEYVEVCTLSERCALGSPLFFGWASSCRADMAIKIFDGKGEDSEEEEYDIIFSIEHLSKTSKQLEALQFQAISEQYEHVELVDGQWFQVSAGPNSYRLHCSIYNALNSCSLYKISIFQISK